jgi:hypothetical protein
MQSFIQNYSLHLILTFYLELAYSLDSREIKKHLYRCPSAAVEVEPSIPAFVACLVLYLCLFKTKYCHIYQAQSRLSSL